MIIKDRYNILHRINNDITQGNIKDTYFRTLNIHPSLLPNFRGRYSIPHAIFENKKYTGLTGHWISEKLIRRNFIYKKIIINDADTAETIYKIFTKYSLKEFKIFVAKILKNNKNLTKKVKIKQGSYKKSLPNNGTIDWNWSGKNIQLY